jgi:hypothetical protein
VQTFAKKQVWSQQTNLTMVKAIDFDGPYLIIYATQDELSAIFVDIEDYRVRSDSVN